MLNRILATKREEIAASKQLNSLRDMLAEISTSPHRTRGFHDRILNASPKTALIAEVKKASPSRGILVEAFDPVGIAQAYERGGASCLSVLTDEQYFMGSKAILKQVRAHVKLPVLRKDFIIDEYQVGETRWIGADCMLLIVAAFQDRTSQVKDLLEMGEEIGLDVLTEVHDEKEVETALKLGSHFIGINNRDLMTFETDLSVTERLARIIPKDRTIVSESGIFSRADVERVAATGARAVLIGESLVTKPDIEQNVRELVG